MRLLCPSQTCVISPKKLNDNFKFIEMIGIFFSLKMKNKWPAFFFHFCNFPPNARKMKRMFFSLKMKSEWPAFIFHFCNFPKNDPALNFHVWLFPNYAKNLHIIKRWKINAGHLLFIFFMKKTFLSSFFHLNDFHLIFMSFFFSILHG